MDGLKIVWWWNENKKKFIQCKKNVNVLIKLLKQNVLVIIIEWKVLINL